MWFIIKVIEYRFDRTEFQAIFKQKYVMSLKYTGFFTDISNSLLELSNVWLNCH